MTVWLNKYTAELLTLHDDEAYAFHGYYRYMVEMNYIRLTDDHPSTWGWEYLGEL